VSTFWYDVQDGRKDLCQPSGMMYSMVERTCVNLLVWCTVW